MKAYVFLGQGEQFTGMGKDLYETSAVACVKNNPDVFKPREKPWINAENSTT